MYVLADTVQDLEVPIMKLCLKKVEGINEPVKLIAASGFAVGSCTNKVYVWEVSYQAQDVE